MFDDEFVRVYDNGYYIVAEFRYVLRPFDGNGNSLSTFVLNEDNLRKRIENRKRYNMNIANEVAALSAIEAFKNEYDNRR